MTAAYAPVCDRDALVRRIEKQKEDIAETNRRLSDEIAKPAQYRARIQRLRTSLAFNQSNLGMLARKFAAVDS